MRTHVLVQLTDLHCTATGTMPSGVPARANLVACLAHIVDAGLAPEAIIITGDLTNDGERAAYADLRVLVEAAASAICARVLFVPGNHDDRGAFRELLLDEDPEDGPINAVHTLDGLRVVTLDSTVPGEQGGFLAQDTLAFLTATLAEPASDGTIVALHHPPVATPISPMAEMALTNPGSLRDVIEGTDVRLVLCGHNHHAAATVVGGVPLWVSPATSYLADVTSTHTFRGIPGSAFTRVDVGDDIVVTPIPVSTA